MKIALVMAGDEEGGLEKHVVDMANGLAQRGLTVSVVAHPRYGDRFDSGVRFLPVDLALGRRNPLGLWLLWRALRRSGAEVVHAHGSKAASMVGTLLPFLNVRSVATLHSRKKNVRMFRRFQRVIAVSKVSTLNLDHPGIVVIHNGIAPLAARPQPASDAWPGDGGLPRVLAVGRLVPVKGFDVLIQAWKQIPARLAIAGDGQELDALQSAITRGGLTDKVRLLGHRDDVPALLAAADLLVISSHYEGCPYTLVEALHASVPVVSTSVGAMPEILPSEVLCPPGDADALGERLQLALGDLEGLRMRFADVFTQARYDLTFDRLLDNTLAVYSELASSNQAGSSG